MSRRPASAQPSSPGSSLSHAKSSVRKWLRANDLGAVATTIKRLDRALPWVVFFFLLERLIPAKPIRSVLSVNKLQDFLYPVFAASVQVGMLLVGYEPVRSFTANFLPLIDFRLLDGLPLFWQALGGFVALDLTIGSPISLGTRSGGSGVSIRSTTARSSSTR